MCRWGNSNPFTGYVALHNLFGSAVCLFKNVVMDKCGALHKTLHKYQALGKYNSVFTFFILDYRKLL